MLVLLEIVLVAAAVFGVVAYVLGSLGGMTVVEHDVADDGLPPGRLAPAAVDGARFGLAFRGYRMAEVDSVLDRLRDELSARDAELFVLRGGAPPIDHDEHEHDHAYEGHADADLDPSAAEAPADDVVEAD